MKKGLSDPLSTNSAVLLLWLFFIPCFSAYNLKPSCVLLDELNPKSNRWKMQLEMFQKKDEAGQTERRGPNLLTVSLRGYNMHLPIFTPA